MSTAVVFPGMGPSTFADVGKFMIVNPVAKARLAEASEAVGYDVLTAFSRSEHAYTEVAQVAFVVNSIAVADWTRDHLGLSPLLCAGPSNGLRAATAFSGALSFADAVRLTADLARWEREYFDRAENADIVTHSFVRTPGDALAEMLGELDERGEWAEISSYLEDGFFNVSLREHNLDWFKQRIRDVGGYSMYTMRPPAHSSLFEPQREHAAREIYPAYTFADPELPLVADHDGALVTTGEGVRELHLASIVQPVRWDSVVQTLRRHGVEQVCVTGSDNLFRRLRSTKSFEVVAVDPDRALKHRKALVQR
ncbi:ACP S-malonyltransferase [Allokutzneria sp. NRRL B-24872]|uniref:ACP S-malonyltransferase n=1 Tax=Allokutzneria sp. NRRL B-24872 TaxID=1137961 RepID=UPI000A37E012|nr:ACP S-malonyltransferase [Allokutzneria sp. NRRL B-24872]